MATLAVRGIGIARCTPDVIDAAPGDFEVSAAVDVSFALEAS
jgi:hypothetical protein